MKEFQISPLDNSDKDWVSRLIKKQWSSIRIVIHGKIYQADKLPGFIAVQENKRVGLLTYQISNNECEIVTLNSLAKGIGIGSALIDAVKKTAVNAKCKRLLVVTTNDNMPALHFYQKRGFSLIKVYPKAIKQARKLKPEIPLIGLNGIPLQDEIELELIL